MGLSLYWGMYPKECNNEKVLPYLKIYTDNEDNEIYVKREDQKKFFESLRKYATKYDEPGCYVLQNSEDFYNFLIEVKDISNWGPYEYNENSIADWTEQCVIIWVR